MLLLLLLLMDKSGVANHKLTVGKGITMYPLPAKPNYSALLFFSLSPQ